MARNKGTFNFSANFEPIVKAPLDARQLVQTHNDLTNPSTWEDLDNNVWLYDGAIVSVANDVDPNKNGIYYLNDAANYTGSTSWTLQGAGFSGSTSGTTLGRNGLNSFYSGYIELGGALLRNTTINGVGAYDFNIIDVNVFQISGVTSVINLDNNGILLASSGQSVVFNGGSGLTYGGNYINTFTDNSLITKQYADDAIANNSNVVNIYNPTGLTYSATTLDDFIGVSGGSNVYLPSNPKFGHRIAIADIEGNAYLNNIIINGSGKNILNTTNALIDTDYGSITFIYNGMFWSITSFIN